ncbi:hypothetical protein CCH79_00004865, partial [Gambusia affinis]
YNATSVTGSDYAGDDFVECKWGGKSDYPPRSGLGGREEEQEEDKGGGPKDTNSDTESDFQEVFMGCTIYAASPKALPVDEARGQDRYYQLPHYSHPYGNCSQRIAACRARFQLIEDLSYEDVKKCYRGSVKMGDLNVLGDGEADSSKEEGGKERSRKYLCVSQLKDRALDVRECVCEYGANVLSLVQSSRPLWERVVSAPSGAGGGGGGEGGGVNSAGAVRAGRSAKELLMTLPCPSAQTVSKYNSQYHKLFPCVPKDEILMKVYSCALLRDILLQGRLYISRNWLCFYANLFGKDIKVAIPVVTVRLVKKHKTAGLVPNGLAITTDTNQKYVFVSLLSRDSVYDVLRRICTHLQVNGKSLSLKQFMEEPALSLDEFPAPDEFPVVDEFPSVLKWRRKPSVVSVSSSLPDLLGSSTSGRGAADTLFKTEPPLEGDTRTHSVSDVLCTSETIKYSVLLNITTHGFLQKKFSGAFTEHDKTANTAPQCSFRHITALFLRVCRSIKIIILLILSSCYLAFRVCSLEQQLSFLSNPNLPLRE